MIDPYIDPDIVTDEFNFTTITTTTHDYSELEDDDYPGKPRRLTSMEIKDILDSIPIVPSMDSYASYVATENIKQEAFNEISKVELSPSGLQKYKSLIVNKFNCSYVKDGDSVGIVGATSLTSAATQGTMKTHQMSSGETGMMEGGIKGMAALLNIQKKINNPVMMVHFNRRVTFDQVFDMRATIVNVTVKQVILTRPIIGIISSYITIDNDILPDGILRRYWWHNLDAIHTNIQTYSNQYVIEVVLR